MNQIMAYLANQKIINPSTPWCSTISIMLLLLTSSNTLLAQNGELPPVSFPSGKNVCDNSPWQLVLYDNFDGTSLDTNTWITFNSWAGMSPKDHSNWSEGRIVLPYNAIMKDQNVVVSNGSVKLQVKKESTFWKCDTCAVTRHTDYSSARLSTPFTKPFDAGRFEARIKMPTFMFAHSTFWTWWGSPLNKFDSTSAGVNEIDIAEAYGKSGPYGSVFGYFPRTNFSLHAWPSGPKGKPSNSYDMVHDEVMNRFPKQSWADWMGKDHFVQQDYHKYTCEWDSAIVRFYLDDVLVSEQWKYYQERNYTTNFLGWTKTHYYKVGSSCNPDAGVWRIMRGFPYNNHSGSNLRFDCTVDQSDGSHPNGLVGEMEIDYVKMWQRHPQNGWANICNTPIPTISGPSIICNTATYTISHPTPNGYWFTPGTNLTVLASNNSSITVQLKTSQTMDDASISYNAVDSACSVNFNQISKRVDIGMPIHSGTVCAAVTNPGLGTLQYNLSAHPSRFGLLLNGRNYNSPTTFEWDVYYGPSGLLHYHSFGRYISTPSISYVPSSINKVQWQVKITNACGTITKTGTMNYFLMRVLKDINTDTDSNNIYAFADVTDIESYENAISKRVSNLFLPETADSITVKSAIEQIAMEELAPYIVWDSSQFALINTERRINNMQHNSLKESKFYPNPGYSQIKLQLSEQYDSKTPVIIRVTDLMGSQHIIRRIAYQAGDIVLLDIAELPSALYELSIEQTNRTEHFKIFKQ